MWTSKRIATRESYGNALLEIGKEYENMVVLDADLSVATKTDLFRTAFPERHINCGISEQNMVGIASGLANSGKIPFISSFAMFVAGRAYEQIRNSICYPAANVKIGATHAGVSVGEDGATHQCIEDISLMRILPEMVVINPADDIETNAAVKAAIEYEGPVYIRLGRFQVPVFNNEKEYKFQVGKGMTLKSGNDVSIIATGLEVYEALKAAEMLEEDGVSTEVINIHTIKPLDTELILLSAQKTSHVVTVEEHSIIGGLGTTVCELLSEKMPTKVLRIGIEDQFTKSGPAKELLKTYGLDAKGIYKKIMDFMS